MVLEVMTVEVGPSPLPTVGPRTKIIQNINHPNEIRDETLMATPPQHEHSSATETHSYPRLPPILFQ